MNILEAIFAVIGVACTAFGVISFFGKGMTPPNDGGEDEIK